MDDVDIPPGTSLRDSIRDLIAASDATICLVSASSLQSLWVIWEIRRFVEASPNGKFLPAYLDQEFLRDHFVGEVQKRVDARLEDLTTEMTGRLKKSWSVEDLSPIHASLSSLRSDLPNVVRQLRNLCCIDLTQPNFEEGFRKIYAGITGEVAPIGRITLAGTLDHTSYAERRRQIEDHVAAYHLEEASRRTMDLLREFFGSNKEAVRQATRLCGQIRQLSEAYERECQKPGSMSVQFLDWYNERIFGHAEKLLDLIPVDLPNVA